MPVQPVSWYHLAFLPIALVVVPGMGLSFFPAVGQLVANSRWTPRAWGVALAIVALGYAMLYYGLLQPRLIVCFWAPLYALGLYTLALRIFTRALGRAPRDAYRRGFDPGFFWDAFFAWSVMMLSILPVAYLLAPR